MDSRHQGPSSAQRLRCGQCGSRRFRRDPDTGLVICQEGHVLQGYREEEVQEDGDFVNVSSQKRYSRKGSKGKKAKAAKEVYGKERGEYLIYECLQLILRLQLKALRQEWPHLPPEIEAIARDLWTMFVSIAPSLKPTPYSENLKFVTAQIHASRQEARARSTSRGRGHSQASTAGSDSHADRDQELEDEEEKRLEAEISRLDEGQDYNSKEKQSTSRPCTAFPPRSRPRERAADKPMLALAAIIYLSLVTARVPILWGDLRCLFASGRVPFLSAAFILPSAMTAKLPENQLRRIEMDTVPTISAFQQRTFRLADSLTKCFSQAIQFPELNAPPILWRCVQDMGLSPAMYNVALALLTYLGIPLAVVPAASVSDPWSLLGSPRVDLADTAQPILPPLSARLGINGNPPCATRCTIIMGAVVIAAKMRYGLDGLDRIAEPFSPAGSVPPLSQWLAALSESQDDRSIDPHFAYELAAHPSACSGEQIDSLLDFAEETLTETVQPNVRSMWDKEDVNGLFGGRLPPRSISRCIRPYNYEGEDAPPPRKSLLDAQTEWRAKLHQRLYPLAGDDIVNVEPRHPQPLRPGEAYPDPSCAAHPADVHPYYRRVLCHAAMCIGLSGAVEEDAVGAGWREMGNVVGEMEQTLIKRLQKEARLPLNKPVSVMIDRNMNRRRGRPRKVKVTDEREEMQEEREEGVRGEVGSDQTGSEDMSQDGSEGEETSWDSAVMEDGVMYTRCSREKGT